MLHGSASIVPTSGEAHENRRLRGPRKLHVAEQEGIGELLLPHEAARAAAVRSESQAHAVAHNVVQTLGHQYVPALAQTAGVQRERVLEQEECRFESAGHGFGAPAGEGADEFSR